MLTWRQGYDSNAFIEAIHKTGAEVVVPSRRNKVDQRTWNKELCEERNKVDHLFGKLKQFHRIATLYEKLFKNFMGFVKIAAIVVWIKSLNPHYALVFDIPHLWQTPDCPARLILHTQFLS